MDDVSCPRCRTTKYRNPQMKILINICGHSLCESCVQLLFARGSGNCPECETPLNRQKFRVQFFENSKVEKEVDIRRKVLKDFNRKEDDFDTLREYNDYLELVETYIFNLVNNVDVDETKKKIEQYRRENKALIAKNKVKLGRDETYIENMLELEREEAEMRRKMLQEEEKEERALKARSRLALINELANSDKSADEILAQHAARERENELKKEQVKATQFSSGIRIGGKSSQQVIPPPVEAGLPYAYTERCVDIYGPELPAMDALDAHGYSANVRVAKCEETAGGYSSLYACYRALQDAFSGLYLMNDPPS